MMLERKKLMTRVEDGFSLVELMVVVAIIGVLAAIAVPKFGTFTAKARQSEAKTNLTHIHSLQEAYVLDNQTYLGAATILHTANSATCTNNNLGFNAKPCATIANGGSRYGYVATSGTAIAFVATATAAASVIIPTCTSTDVQTVTQEKVFAFTTNAVQVCAT